MSGSYWFSILLIRGLSFGISRMSILKLGNFFPGVENADRHHNAVASQISTNPLHGDTNNQGAERQHIGIVATRCELLKHRGKAASRLGPYSRRWTS
jgi:hypothetical protein